MEKILRPPTGHDLSFEQAAERVKDFEKELSQSFDEDFADIADKEDISRNLLKRIAAFVKEASGEEHAWPAYDVVTKEILEEVDKIWKEVFENVGESVGMWHRKDLREARRRYATKVAKMFLKKAAARSCGDDERTQWNTCATRSFILLSPLTPHGGIWPIPTARPLKEAQDMLSRNEVGISEVSYLVISQRRWRRIAL